MNEFVALFCGLDAASKSSLLKPIPILDLIPWKKSESMGYDDLQPYERLNLIRNKIWLAQEYVDKVVLTVSTGSLVSLYVLDNSFVQTEGKLLIMLTTRSTCLILFLISLFESFLSTHSIK